MLTKQVALLVSEYLAKHRMKVLQSKQEAVQARRDVLLATKAKLELKQLRRWGRGCMFAWVTLERPMPLPPAVSGCPVL